MKKIILISIAVLVYSCKNERSNIPDSVPYFEQKEMNLTEYISDQLNSGVVNDNVFLDFKLKMTPQEYSSHLNSLLKNEEVFQTPKSRADEFRYIFDFGTSDILLGNAEPFYTEDKLYKLQLKIFSADNNYETIAKKILDLLIKKYGESGFTFKNSSMVTNEWYWVEGNRMIVLDYDFNHTILKYIDIPLMYDAQKNQEAIIEGKTKSIENAL